MITQEQYNALNDKLDLYIKHQNEREKEFRELEREVYRLKQAQVTPIRQERDLGRVRDDNSTETALRLGTTWIA